MTTRAVKRIDLRGIKIRPELRGKCCAVCAAPPTHGIVQPRHAVSIRSGRPPYRFVEHTTTYYCERHLP